MSTELLAQPSRNGCSGPLAIAIATRYRYSLSKKPDKIDSDSESRYR